MRAASQWRRLSLFGSRFDEELKWIVISFLIAIPGTFVASFLMTALLWPLEPVVGIELARHAGPEDWVFAVNLVMIVALVFAVLKVASRMVADAGVRKNPKFRTKSRRAKGSAGISVLHAVGASRQPFRFLMNRIKRGLYTGSQKGGFMLKSILVIPIFLIGVAMFTAQTAVAQSSERARLEERISWKVEHELLSLPYYGVFDSLQYKVEGRTVTLQGQVNNGRLISDAQHAVNDIREVEVVNNEIELLPPNTADDEIRLAVFRAVYAENGPLFRYRLGTQAPVHIIVDRGHVTLIGELPRKSDKTYALLSARQVSGTFGVEDKIKVTGESSS